MVEETWTEGDSTVYRELARIAVPSRAEQMATLLALFPFGRDEDFRIVEIGAGEGALTEAALACFPNATALALTDYPHAAGSASAVLGTAQFVFGGAAAPLVGVAGRGSAVPMALLMALFGACALVTLGIAQHVRRPRVVPRPAGR